MQCDFFVPLKLSPSTLRSTRRLRTSRLKPSPNEACFCCVWATAIEPMQTCQPSDSVNLSPFSNEITKMRSHFSRILIVHQRDGPGAISWSLAQFPLSCVRVCAHAGRETSAHKKSCSVHKCFFQKCFLHKFHKRLFKFRCV